MKQNKTHLRLGIAALALAGLGSGSYMVPFLLDRLPCRREFQPAVGPDLADRFRASRVRAEYEALDRAVAKRARKALRNEKRTAPAP